MNITQSNHGQPTDQGVLGSVYADQWHTEIDQQNTEAKVLNYIYSIENIIISSKQQWNIIW